MKTLSHDEDKREILARIAALRLDSARQWGKMTCGQMICHLSDAFLAPLGEKVVSSARVPVPRAVFKFAALRMPMQWPHGVQTRPEVEQGVGGTPPSEFEADRAKSVEVMERFVAERPSSDHAMFGRMTADDWMRWGYLHCDHHLRQFSA
jgi:hypothetical protein